MAKKTIHLPTRKLTVELNFKPSGQDFPRDHKSETLDAHIERALRRILTRDGGQR